MPLLARFQPPVLTLLKMNALLQKLEKLTAPDAPPDGAEDAHVFSAMPTAEQYAGQAQARARWFLLGGGLLAGLVAFSFVAFGLDNILLPVALLAGVLTPVLLWRFPRFVLYGTLVAVCLFETGPVSGLDGRQYADALTDRIPFFWNVNTIFQIYAHADFKGVPLNLFEIFILTAGICSGLRAVYTQNTSLRGGPLLLPIGIYMAFVLVGWVNGMLTGGDFKVSLQEVRSQFYFGLAYLMAVNMIRDRRQLSAILWTVAACAALKGVLLTLRRYVTLHGLPLPDQGIDAHEEVFFFDCFAALLLALSVFGAYTRLRWAMIALLPFVLLGSLACNRRAGTAAFIVIIPLLVLAAYQALPARRRLISALSVAGFVLFAGYYVAFQNSDNLLAQPARAIKSQFQPDPRDASSNAYRDAENADLMATIRSAPLQGFGYGKHMFHAVPIADISKDYEWWDIMTHNQVLWVWMRVGSFGFLAFWMMVAAIIVCAARTVRDPAAAPDVKAVALTALLIIGTLQIFGLLDLQFSNFRDMLFAGLWAGMAAALPTLAPAPAMTRKEAAR